MGNTNDIMLYVCTTRKIPFGYIVWVCVYKIKYVLYNIHLEETGLYYFISWYISLSIEDRPFVLHVTIITISEVWSLFKIMLCKMAPDCPGIWFRD